MKGARFKSQLQPRTLKRQKTQLGDPGCGQTWPWSIPHERTCATNSCLSDVELDVCTVYCILCPKFQPETSLKYPLLDVTMLSFISIYLVVFGMEVSYLENMGPFIVSFKQVPRIPLGKPVAISYLLVHLVQPSLTDRSHTGPRRLVNDPCN